jgi:O-antigen/teichoic acid export membrane protein
MATSRTAPRSGRQTVLSAESLVSAASWMSGAHLIAQAFAYGSLIVLARLLPPDSFGTVAAGTAIVWVAVMLMDSGTHGSIVVGPQLTHSALRRTFRRCLLVAAALAAVMAVGAEAIVGTVVKGGDATALAVLALSLPLYAVALIPQAVLHRAMEFGKLARLTAASNAGSAAVAVVAGLAGAGIWALVARQLLWFALLAALASALARPYLPARSSTPARIEERRGTSDHRWFLLFGMTLLLGMNLDYLVIGSWGDVGEIGLYAMAFLIAFAPVEHFSSQVGKVLFAAAAASGRDASGPRTVQAVRLMSMLLLPLLPVAIVLAPPLIPAILGTEWTGVVPPFQVLLVVGVGHAITNCVGEALSGVGQIAFRAKLNVGWCAATLIALVLLVPLDGIRGAALAHLAVFVPLAGVYATAAASRAGTAAQELWRGLRPIATAVGLQAAATGALALGLSAAGADESVAACTGAVAGLGVMAAVMGLTEDSPARDAAALLRVSLGGGG